MNRLALSPPNLCPSSPLPSRHSVKYYLSNYKPYSVSLVAAKKRITKIIKVITRRRGTNRGGKSEWKMKIATKNGEKVDHLKGMGSPR